jgi:hypothetical protein
VTVPTAPSLSERFPIRIGARSAPLLRVLFGVSPDRAWVRLADGLVTARFGRFEVRSDIENVAHWRIEGPWLWITAIGVRMSIRHRDLSFAGSPRGGVRLDFATPVRWSVFDLPALYVGVDDLEGFAAALSALGIPGQDARA